MRNGLRQASFSPPQTLRDRRDPTRDRPTWVQERSRAVDRLQGVLERTNITLAAVATDMMGISRRAILAALIHGWADPATMAELAKGRIRTKRPWLKQALTGLMRDHHRRLSTRQLAPIDVMDEPIDGLSVEIMHGLEALDVETPPPLDLAGITGEVARAGDRDGPSPPMPFAQEIAVLDTMPGVD
jgi:transposase